MQRAGWIFQSRLSCWRHPQKAPEVPRQAERVRRRETDTRSGRIRRSGRIGPGTEDRSGFIRSRRHPPFRAAEGVGKTADRILRLDQRIGRIGKRLRRIEHDGHRRTILRYETERSSAGRIAGRAGFGRWGFVGHRFPPRSWRGTRNPTNVCPPPLFLPSRQIFASLIRRDLCDRMAEPFCGRRVGQGLLDGRSAHDCKLCHPDGVRAPHGGRRT